MKQVLDEQFGTLQLQVPMMHGPAVKRLQEMLEECGIVIHGGIDGIYGVITSRAVKKFQAANGLLVDGICGPKTWRSLLRALDAFMNPVLATLVDIRGEHEKPRGFARQRNWSEINGVCFHQTGCNMPQSPARWGRLNAHIGVTQEGVAILVNDPTDMIWHAQGFSKNMIGIEIEGNYCGLSADLRTLWKGGGGPHHLNSKMIMALETVFEYLQREFFRNGAEWKHIVAHRQSSTSRPFDPGQEIWQDVATIWAERLGVYAGIKEGYKLSKGLSIPDWWL